MKRQIMTVMLDAFLIINALPPLSFCKNASPTFSMVHLLHRLYGVDAPAIIHCPAGIMSLAKKNYGRRSDRGRQPPTVTGLKDIHHEIARASDNIVHCVRVCVFIDVARSQTSSNIISHWLGVYEKTSRRGAARRSDLLGV